jgi:TctA family transporter
MMEENFRRALLLSRGNMAVFVTRPISGGFIAVCALVVIGVSWSAWRASRRRKLNARAAGGLDVALGLPELELRSDD